MKTDGSDRRVLTESLDRQCAPFPLAREPVWDGGRVAFGVEDGGNVHLYTVAADGSGEPELLVGGEQSTGLYDVVDGVLVYTASTYDRPTSLQGDGNGSRPSATTSLRAGARRRRAVHGQVRRRDRGRRVARAPSRLRRGRCPTLLTILAAVLAVRDGLRRGQVYASAGYCVSSRTARRLRLSEEWGRAIRGTGNGAAWLGLGRLEDVMGVVDAALEQSFLDADRLVLGGSYVASWPVDRRAHS
jgi:hypothetical protein